MAVPQLQTDQTGHRNKARIGFIKETAFDALSTICYWHVRTGQEHNMQRFMTPEAKMAPFYPIAETFWLSHSGILWISREELQEDATLKILSLIQTRREFREVCEHMTEDGSKSVRDDPYQAGYNQLKTLFDFSQYIRFLQLQIEWRTKEKQNQLDELKARKDKRLSLIQRLDTFYPEAPRRWASIQETFDPRTVA